MFVEGEVEVKIKDRSAQLLDDHQLKLWLQGCFKDMSCYRIADFSKISAKEVRATVAIKTAALPEHERKMLESNPNDTVAMRSFIEKMFEGKGTCRSLGDPKLRQS